MKKSKIPPCQNHSLSPSRGALANAPQNGQGFAPDIRLPRTAVKLFLAAAPPQVVACRLLMRTGGR